MIRARHDSSRIKSEVQLLDEGEDQEVYLLKAFILEYMTSYRRAIVERYFFSESRYESPKHVTWRKIKKIIAIILLPALWGAILYLSLIHI